MEIKDAPLMSYEESVRWMRSQPELADLVKNCYLDDNVLLAAQRFKMSEEFEAIQSYIPSRKLRILDLGCGNGIVSCAFAQLGHDVDAVDPDLSDDVGLGAIPALIAQLSQGRISTHRAFAEELPFQSDTFDLVYTRQAVHHFADLNQGVAECARVLKSGGLFFGTREHVVDNEQQMQQFLADHALHKLHGGENAHSLETYKGALQKAGLTPVKILAPYDTVINHFPISNAEMMRMAAIRFSHRFGRRLGAIIAKFKPAVDYHRARLSAHCDVPGRMYSFFVPQKLISMRVLYDGTIYTMQKAGGINRYFASIISRLPVGVTPTLFAGCSENKILPESKKLRVARRRYSFRPGRIANKLQQRYNRAVNDGRRYDLAHPTYYHLLSGREISDYSCPVVVTVYDMIHERFPELMPSPHYTIDAKRAAIRAADAVLCISNSTRQDLLEFYPEAEAKTYVTHLAADINAAQSHGPEAVPERPYFLHVGSRAFYKNFSQLLTSLAQAVSSRPALTLAVVGTPFTEEEQNELSALGLENHVEHFGLVGDAHLAKLYRNALAFVYPSRYEGFGIPVLEAMQCDTVVIAADRSSIPEVAGDAALLFDPDAPDELTDLLRLLADGLPAREDRLARGRARAACFSWDRTAAQTVEVYCGVAQSRRIA